MNYPPTSGPAESEGWASLQVHGTSYPFSRRMRSPKSGEGVGGPVHLMPIQSPVQLAAIRCWSSPTQKASTPSSISLPPRMNFSSSKPGAK